MSAIFKQQNLTFMGFLEAFSSSLRSRMATGRVGDASCDRILGHAKNNRDE